MSKAEQAQPFDWKEARKSRKVGIKREHRAALKEIEATMREMRGHYDKTGIVGTDMQRIIRFCERLQKGARA